MILKAICWSFKGGFTFQLANLDLKEIQATVSKGLSTNFVKILFPSTRQNLFPVVVVVLTVSSLAIELVPVSR